MGVISQRYTEYVITCDKCYDEEVCPGGEMITNKRSAINWAHMHKVNNKILCNKCFEQRNKKLEVQDEVKD
jgi:hypothetical protein